MPQNLKHSTSELQSFVKDAVELFLKKDKNLLNLGVHEQAITHRIALYLEQVFNDPGLNFDCEYNRSLKESKTFTSLNESDLCKVCDKNKKQDRTRRFRPDILVHKRYSHDNNLIAIEIKRHKYCKFDEVKIIALTHPGDNYKYKLGLCLYFKDNKPVYNWFIDGKKQE